MHADNLAREPISTLLLRVILAATLRNGQNASHIQSEGKTNLSDRNTTQRNLPSILRGRGMPCLI